MSSLKKLLAQFTAKERVEIESLIVKIVALDWRSLDVKKLKGYRDIFRVRKGNLRVVFTKKEQEIIIFSIERRNDHTYNL